MRLISFSMTKDAVRERRKTVTRRIGWRFVQVGDRLRGVEKAMGLRKGERVQDLALIEVLDVRREPLMAITEDDVEREGYPDRDVAAFIARFQRAMRCHPHTEVTRIEFRYVDVPATDGRAGRRLR